MAYQGFYRPTLHLNRREAQDSYANDPKAEAEERDRLFASRYPIARAVSKQLQSSLDLYDGRSWPLPESKGGIDVERRNRNAERIRKTMDECRNFGVSMHRESMKGEYLDPCLSELKKGKEDVAKKGLQVGDSWGETLPRSPEVSFKNAQEVLNITEPRADELCSSMGLQTRKTSRGLTEALCNAVGLRANPVLSLTLEDVETEMSSPGQNRQILLRHFETGLDGVEAIIHGQAHFDAVVERDDLSSGRPLPQSTNEAGACHKPGGAIEHAVFGSQSWTFFGVRYKQTGHNFGGHGKSRWLCFGVPQEAALEVSPEKEGEEQVDVEIGGGW